jgi:pyridoxal phosphate enzyme (YggS family)
MPESLEDRLDQIRRRIAAACAKVGRAPADVALLPISKTFDASVIREAVGLGLRRFGENKTQEVRQKAQALADLGLQWVLVGHLQTNKARDAVRHAVELQSLDRLDLAQALDKRLAPEGRTLDVLIEVKTSSEPSKAGLAPDELPRFLRQLESMDTLRVKGLMTLAVNSADEQAVRDCFRLLRLWRDRLRDSGFEQVQRLSMGMSGDFELAIEEGSTEVRIGSALFGQRSYMR